MILYYRLLGLVVVLGLALTGMLFFTLLSYLSATQGLTLTLAGVTGIIVSVGVTVDSYVVYFERLKDEVRTGKTVRSSLEPGFQRSFRTIVAADLVSLLGADVLYLFTTSSVKGFAFFLGMSTAIDLVLAYSFMHPLVSLMARQPEAGAACPASASPRRLDVAGSDEREHDHRRRIGRAERDDIPGVTRRHRFSDFYHERTNFQFIKHSQAVGDPLRDAGGA